MKKMIALISATAVLLAVVYLYGEAAKETAVRQWEQFKNEHHS